VPEANPVKQIPVFIKNFLQLCIYRVKSIIKLAMVNWTFSTRKQK